MTRGLLSLMASRQKVPIDHPLHCCASLTLGSNENERHLAGVAIVIHLRVVLIDRLETLFVLQTEDEDHGINPMGELEEKRALSLSFEERRSDLLEYLVRWLRLG